MLGIARPGRNSSSGIAWALRRQVGLSGHQRAEGGSSRRIERGSRIQIVDCASELHQAKLQPGGRDGFGDGNRVWKAESLVIAKYVGLASKNILGDDRPAGSGAEVAEVIA